MDAISMAFKDVKRSDFVTESQLNLANYDIPLPIGYGQTISQPSTVESMIGWLELEPDNKVLDIGSGSGWTSAMLAKIVGPKGRVFAVEIIPELVKFGRNNCQKYNFLNIRFFNAKKELGLLKYAPYDRILVSASAKELPTSLINQLKIGGKLVIPVNNDILEIARTSFTNYETIKHSGYVFVPLV